MENLNKYISSRMNKLHEKEYNFQELFDLIYDQDNKVFAEYQESFQIKKVSYLEFKKYTFQTATYYSDKLNDEKNVFVGMLLENSINFLSTFWAILALGYRPVLLNAKLPASVNNEIIQTLNIQTLITTNELSKDININKLVIIDNEIGIDKNIQNLSEYVTTTWGNEFAINTTATSLNYKICIYTSTDILYQIYNTEEILSKNKLVKKHYNGSLKQLMFLPLYHIFGLFATYFWFSYFGRTFVFLSNYAPDTILKTIRRHKVTHIFAVPLLWNTIAKEITKTINNYDDKMKKKINKGINLSIKLQQKFPRLGLNTARHLFKEIIDKTLGDSVYFLISGGGYISKDTLKLFNAVGYPLHNGYGSTELGITSVELSKKIKHRMLGNVGRPFEYVKYKISDGILYVKSKSMCSKIYYRDGSIVNVNKKEWFNTNDCASVGNHAYYINGRCDDVIVGSSGEKINPDLIENNLLFTTINNFVIMNYNNSTSLIIEIPSLNPLSVKKVISEVKEKMILINSLGYTIDKIYYTSNPIVPKNAIKVSRQLLNRSINEGKVVLHSFDELYHVDNMTQEEVEDSITLTIKKIIADVIDKDENEIASSSNLVTDLGISSLDSYTIVLKLQEEFNVELTFDKSKYITINDISKYIMEKIGK